VYISRESSPPAPSNFPRAFHTDATRPLLVVRAYIAACAGAGAAAAAAASVVAVGWGRRDLLPSELTMHTAWRQRRRRRRFSYFILSLFFVLLLHTDSTTSASKT